MSTLTRRNLRRTFQNLQRGLQGQQSAANQQRNFDRLMRGLQGLPEHVAPAAPVHQTQAPFYREPILINGPNMSIEPGSTNTISMNNISSGNSMVDFHDEYRHKRFYKEKNLRHFTKNRNGFPLNPITRERITNATLYKASVSAGGKRKQKGKTRRVPKKYL